METAFTPITSTFGGILIGISALMLMAFHGRIMGATGIFAGFLKPANRSDFIWRAVVLLGMVSAPIAIWLMFGRMPEVQVPVSRFMLIIGGVLVGIGATFGAGCPSGHGVCGIGRLSMRSIVAVLTFMVTTAITVFIIRHVIGG